jgi:hypothetical protein
MRTTRLRDSCHDLSVAPSCRGVEGEWLEARLYLLETNLTPRALGAGGREVWPSSEFTERNHTHSDLFWKSRGDHRVVPVDDDRGVE